MGFVANVKADFKALPQRLRSGVMPKIIVGLNFGLCSLPLVGVALDGLLYDWQVWVSWLVLCIPYLIVTYCVLSQRLKISLTVILGLFFCVLCAVSDQEYGWSSSGVPFINEYDVPGHVLVSLGSWLLAPIANLIILWTWTPQYRVRRWSSSVVSSSGISEEELYATVWSELESGDIQQGLWAKLWSEYKGDEDKTKAGYLKARVRQLLDAQIDNETTVEPSETVGVEESEWNASSVDDLFKQGAEAVGGNSWSKKEGHFGFAKFVGVIISIGVVGYYFLAPDIALTNVKQPPLSTVSLPTSGTVRAFDDGWRPVTLKIKTTGDLNYLLKLAKPNQKTAVLDVVVRGGNTEVIKVPIGDYEMRWATGKAWYGYGSLFGNETAYAKANEMFTFDKGWITTVTLYPVSDGNLRTSAISTNEF